MNPERGLVRAVLCRVILVVTVNVLRVLGMPPDETALIISKAHQRATEQSQIDWR